MRFNKDEIITDTSLVENKKEEENQDDPVSIPTIIANMQHLSEIRKLLSSVANSEEMLGCLNKIEISLAETHCQHREQIKIYQFFSRQ